MNRSKAVAGGLVLMCLGAYASAHELAAGQQLTFVLSESKPDGEQIQQAYFSQAFPMAQANGMRELTTFKVLKTLYGDHAPQGSGLYLWPSPEAAKRTREDETYVTKLRPMRTQAWNELRSIDMRIVAPLKIELDRTKLYTAALIWTRDAAGYQKVFEASRALRKKIGAREVLHLPGARYESLKEGETTPPDHLVILEWPDAAAIAFYQNDRSLDSMRADYEKTIARFDWYQLGFWD